MKRPRHPCVFKDIYTTGGEARGEFITSKEKISKQKRKIIDIMCKYFSVNIIALYGSTKNSIYTVIISHTYILILGIKLKKIAR